MKEFASVKTTPQCEPNNGDWGQSRDSLLNYRS